MSQSECVVRELLVCLESPAAVRIPGELAGSITTFPCGVISSFSYASSAEPDGDEKVSMASCCIVMVSQVVFVCMSSELCSRYKFNPHLSSESWPLARTLEIRMQRAQHLQRRLGALDTRRAQGETARRTPAIWPSSSEARRPNHYEGTSVTQE